MKHVIISDTHAPQPLDNAYNLLKQQSLSDVDAIVINGDLLGVFSLTGANQHKRVGLTQAHKKEYLAAAAPRFAALTEPITQDHAIKYVEERYEWCYTQLKRFSKLKKTIFNMGNHESPFQWLVLQEFSFLTGHQANIAPQTLQEIYDAFEEKLHELEQTHDFHYIRHKPLIQDKTLIMGIPGESHDASAPEQEAKTQNLISRAQQHLAEIDTIIIYNHTQGNYQPDGSFSTASPSLKQFMDNLPAHITQKIFVQSHNHWSYTQFIKDDFHYILNNAGLHNGIFNTIEFNSKTIILKDVDPIRKRSVELTARESIVDSDHLRKIAANYPNALDIFIARRTQV